MPFKFIYQSGPGAGSLAETQSQSISAWTEPPLEQSANESKAVTFHSQFDGCMELKGDRETVMNYLDAHQGWFCRCAEPMEVTPIGDNGYAITVGHFGSHGFEVEPKIALHLLPHDNAVYRIETLEHPESKHQCYEVSFSAALNLVEADQNTPLTRVEWTLDLAVSIHFPAFIYRLPQKLIQYTGDQVLTQIVRQVSKRLTAKVQDDFHATVVGE
ncbi:MAG: DUF1997 domain-containing protein [Cyanobacteria bacterium P01_F01_bin.42]